MPDDTTNFVLGDAAIEAATARKKATGERTLTHCENCGAALTGNYCVDCGQQAVDYRRSLFHILVDAADSFFNWDTKFFKTIGVLLRKPWCLTNDFNAGRRARYVHPLRLYLLASITFFLVLRAMQFATPAQVELTAADRSEFAAGLEKLTGPDSPLNPESRARIDALRERLREGDGTLTAAERAEIKTAYVETMKSTMRDRWSKDERDKMRQTLRRFPENKTPLLSVRTEADSPGAPPTAPPAPEGFNMKWGHDDQPKTPFQNWMERRIKDKVGDDGTKVTLFLETLRSNIPTMLLFCIPLFALILKVLYLGRRRFYVEHLVYALHIHSFIFLGVAVLLALVLAANRFAPVVSGLLIGLFSLTLTVQVFLSIRRVYGQGWFFTFLKFALGGVVYLIVLALAVGVTAFVTILLPG